MCFDRTRQPVIIIIPWFHLFNPKCLWEFFFSKKKKKRKEKKKRKKENPTPKRAVCPQEVIHGAGFMQTWWGRRWEAGRTGSGKRQPREDTQTFMVSASWKKVKNRMTKRAVIRIVCVVKWANIEAHWQIRGIAFVRGGDFSVTCPFYSLREQTYF